MPDHAVFRWVQDNLYYLNVCDFFFFNMLLKNSAEDNICGKFLKKRQKCTSSKVGLVLFSFYKSRGGPFRLLLPLPCPPASTLPGEGLPGGLLKDSCGLRKRRSMQYRLKAGTFMLASEYETLIRTRCGKKLRLYIRPPIIV